MKKYWSSSCIRTISVKARRRLLRRKGSNSKSVKLKEVSEDINKCIRVVVFEVVCRGSRISNSSSPKGRSKKGSSTKG